jgi:predicted transcriptional regulator of viral defense system
MQDTSPIVLHIITYVIQYAGSCLQSPTYCNMHSDDSEIAKVLQEVNHRGLLRPSDLSSPSARMHLTRLYQHGKIQRVARGVYAPISTKTSESNTLAIASTKVPKGVLCLISALHYYGLTTQVPWEVWLAIDKHSRKPKITEFQVHFVWYSPNMLNTGVTSVTIDGAPVRIFNPAKTIVDCFKYRHKIGMDVCLEALREGWRKRLFTMDDLWKFSKICRVTTVIRPYLETLT